MIKRLNHVMVTIPKGAEADGRAFYCKFLGLLEIEKPESLQGRGGFWLQVGEHQVHVGTEDNIERQATRAHFAYEVTDLVLWRKRLGEYGIEVKDGIPIPGYERFEFRDPFGNRVEFMQRSLAQ